MSDPGERDATSPESINSVLSSPTCTTLDIKGTPAGVERNLRIVRDGAYGVILAPDGVDTFRIVSGLSVMDVPGGSVVYAGLNIELTFDPAKHTGNLTLSTADGTDVNTYIVTAT